MNVVSLRPAPVCGDCRERPGLYLLEVDPAALATEGSPLRSLPATARIVCEPCARRHAPDGALPPGLHAARLTAGMLAALAAAGPRCEVVTCSSRVARWGASCPACGDRAVVRAEEEQLDAAERRAERRRASRRKRRAPVEGQDNAPSKP